MNKKDLYKAGKERGFNIASWQDLPELGAKIDKSIDWIGLGDVVTRENVADYFSAIASQSESIDREYSPFEFTAHDINECYNADSLWEAFDNGITKGIMDNWNSRKDYYNE